MEHKTPMPADPAATHADGPSVSAILITLNAEAHLRECLAGLHWCTEIVVVDGGSTDATQVICEEFGARITTRTDWPGFGPQKNRALALATGEWVLSIDADEILTPQLQEEIAQRLAAPANCVAFNLPRRSRFCGAWIRHSGWWPDRVTRLFRRGAAHFSEDLVHEHLVVDGAEDALQEPLLHYTYDDYAQALDKLNRYSTLGAQMAFERGRRASLATALLRSLWAFLRTYVLRRGLLDGRAGFVLAVYNAHATYYRYLKLWRLTRLERSNTTPH